MASGAAVGGREERREGKGSLRYRFDTNRMAWC